MYSSSFPSTLLIAHRITTNATSSMFPARIVCCKKLPYFGAYPLKRIFLQHSHIMEPWTMYFILHLWSYMCIHMPTVSEQVRQLTESQKKKSETAQSQKKQFNGTRFVNICLALCSISPNTVQLCIVFSMPRLNNSCN